VRYAYLITRGAIMNKLDAHWAILRAWETWAPDNVIRGRFPAGNDAERFFRELRKNQPELLDFKAKDKWSAVHECLVKHRKVVN